MYAYLSRKVTLFNQNELCSIADHGQEVGEERRQVIKRNYVFIVISNQYPDITFLNLTPKKINAKGLFSIGGHDGLLKIIQIINRGASDNVGTSGGDPALIQTLEGHSGSVITLAWNAIFQKLASTDENGLTIVWGLQNEIWYEDMINNRNDSFATDMKWSPDGELICIAYNDGAVMVGSVEGSRLWDIEASEQIPCIEWSPDSKNIIFVTERNEIKMYDKLGNHVKSIASGIDAITSVHWFGDLVGKGKKDTVPTLTIASTTGQIRLKRGIGKSNEVTLVSALQKGICRWNSSGKILAICGQKMCEGEEDSILVVEFYKATGGYLYQLLITRNENFVDFNWETSGLMLTVTTERCIYFVHVRPPHEYTALNSARTLVYESTENNNVVFLDMKRRVTVEKSFGKVTKIDGTGKYCLLICTTMEAELTEWERNCSKLVICDEVGTVWSTKGLKIHPDHVSMTDNFAMISDHRNVYVYTFDTTAFDSYLPSHSSGGMERMFDINDKSIHPSRAHNVYNVIDETGEAKITAICATKSLGLFAKEDNQILVYSFPNITRLSQISLECGIPQMIRGNSNSTKFCVIDNANIFQIFDLEKRSHSEVEIRLYVKPPCVDHAWAMEWSADDPNACVIMNDDNVYEINLDGELMNKAGILSHTNGYLLEYSNLEVTLVSLDDILLHPHSILDDFTINLPSKALENMRELMTKESSFPSHLSRSLHKQVWKIFAYQSLEKLDFDTAELAYVLCEDYSGVSFIQNMLSIDDEDMKGAEVLKFLGHYSKAEKKYLSIDRLDLAIQMNIDVRDWSRVRSFVEQPGLSDAALCKIWSTMAEAFVDRRQYNVAAEYYKNAKNYSLAIECLIVSQDYDSMKDLINLLNVDSPCLEDITQRLLSNGLYKLAISCQKKVSLTLAMDTCINLEMWQEAALIASEGKLRPRLDKIAKEKVCNLLEKNKHLHALELCRCIDLTLDAAEILCKLVKSIKSKNDSVVPHNAVKKIFILAAQQVERHREKTIDMSGLKLKGGKAASTIASSIEKFMDNQQYSKNGSDIAKVFDSAWYNAAAHHYIAAAHGKLHNGNAEAAMIIAIRCCEYIDVLNPMEVYSLIALASYTSKFYEICSLSLTKLRTLKNIDQTSSASIQNLAFAIFTKQKPVNSNDLSLCYKECIESGQKYHACTISGKSIAHKRALQCRFCRYYMLEEEARGRKSCALCHGDIRHAEMVIVD